MKRTKAYELEIQYNFQLTMSSDEDYSRLFQ
jgi:hypothetical protein